MSRSVVVGFVRPLVFATVLRPARLDGTSQDSRTLGGADIPPARRSKTDGGAAYRRSGQLSARNIDQLDGEVEEDPRGEAGLPHDGAQPGAASGAKRSRDLTIKGWGLANSG